MPGITDDEFPLDKPEKANELMDWLKSREADKWQAEIERLKAERDEAREWVNRMLAETQVLRCAFCGESYPPGTPDHNHEALTDHVKVCTKHPMREVERELDSCRTAAGTSLAIAIDLLAFHEGSAEKVDYADGYQSINSVVAINETDFNTIIQAVRDAIRYIT